MLYPVYVHKDQDSAYGLTFPDFEGCFSAESPAYTLRENSTFRSYYFQGGLPSRKGLIPSYFNQSADGKFAAKGDEVDLPTNIHSIVNRVFDLVGEEKEPKTAENTATETKASV